MVEINREFRETLERDVRAFVQYNGDASVTDGWKLSIQGKTLEDSEFLYENLIGFLMITKCKFKFGTKRLINCGHPQQQHKLLTIYIPNGVEAKSFAELVYLHISDYTGGDDIKAPESYTHYKNAIYYRNDRDENGEYITAN
tara:strand:- start:17723 stop:18148 length:426 start_codon:yes stop_codon:yes gene_type:complete